MTVAPADRTTLAGRGTAATRALLVRLLIEGPLVTRFYAHGPGLKTAHRRGLIESRRYNVTRWRHHLTPAGLAALAQKEN